MVSEERHALIGRMKATALMEMLSLRSSSGKSMDIRKIIVANVVQLFRQTLRLQMPETQMLFLEYV